MLSLRRAVICGLCLCASGLLALNTPVAVAAPAPQVSSLSRWTLDFTPGDFRVYIDPVSGRAFWYFTYKVVNRTGQDRMFAPRFEILTDDGQVRRSGRDVPGMVVRDIRRTLGSELIEDQNQIIGEILLGPEHAKEGVVVWPATNTSIKELTLFASGLSGETTTVPHPKTGEAIVLSKSMARQYRTPGDILLRPTDPLELVREDWVWR